MSKIRILDCTLRDGGYVNEWEFGKNAIQDIISKLIKSKVDIIECGFLTEKQYGKDFSLFNSTSALKEFINGNEKKGFFVLMLDIGDNDLNIDKLVDLKPQAISGIRLTFNPNNIDKTIKIAEKLKKMGYKIFLQPMKTLNYKDDELINLIKKVNRLKPYAFYIVDSFGAMYKNDLLRLFYLVENNLHEEIKIGFHSHNNLQLSFSLAQSLMNLKTKRDIIIDSSVFGMGRGAGNLATELITRYINDNIQNKYEITPLLNIYDEYLSSIFAKTPWGYSLPHFLSAAHNCHPNYSTYLLNKQTISVETINILLKELSEKDKSVYNKDLIENIYLKYQKHKIDDKKTRKYLSDNFKGKEILVLAPGETISSESSKIQKFIEKEKPIVISVNFSHNLCDYVFISNVQRFNKLKNSNQLQEPVIITSNIAQKTKENTYILNYEKLILDDYRVSDNAGLMLINFLIDVGVKNITLGGFDGFNINREKNYFDKKLISNIESEELIKKTASVKEFLDKFSKTVRLEYLTTSLYAESNKI
ncbi:MAG TPA: aldolase catalytic domain-containing protein [Candidatus Gastranaerophilaceae bacterium]|nr:aldolase catalytic domain-containing protein [Candidatus Gastranaerophilaceae bacterium]